MAKEEQIKSQIILEGEKEYRSACKDINLSLREIGSEMKLATAEFADNAKGAEALTKKQEILKKQLDEQAKKAKAAEAALQKMREAGIEPTDPAYKKMQTNLNNAKAEMAKTEQQIKSTSKELKTSKINWESVGGVVGKVGKAFGTALAALGTAAVGAASALAGMTVSAASYADEILTTSTNTHIATDDLQKYQYALNFIDGDINTLTGTMKKNTQIVNKARDGNKTYTEAYEKLGISITDANGELRDGQDVYWEVIDALGGIENETERDALAMTLLGKSGTELNTIIDAGSEAFKAMGEEAEAMGVVMSEDALSALGAFDDKLQTLKAGLSGLKNSAALIALPFLDDLAERGIPILAEFSTGIQAANGDVTKMGDVIGKGLSDVVNLIVEKLPEFVNMGVNMITSLAEGLVSCTPTIASAAVQIIQTLVNGIAELLPLIIQGAAQMIAGLAQGLAQALPTLIPTIVQVVVQIVQSLIDNIPLLIDAALQLVTGLAEGVIQAIPVLVAALPTLINSLIDALLAAIPQIIQAGIDLLTALVGALPDIITAIVEAIPQIIDGIITAVIGSIPQIIQAGVDLLIALIQNLPTIITTIVQAIPQIVSGICEALIGNIDQIIMAGVQLFVSLIQNLPTIIVEIVKAVPQIVTGIVEAFANLDGELITAGGNLLHGLWEGISGAASWLWEQVSGWASGLVDGIKNFFGIHSPSTVFAEIGGNMAAGVGEGFGDSMGGVESDMTAAMGGAGEMTAAEAVRAVNNGIVANVEGLSDAVNAIVERVITGLNAQGQRLTQAGRDFDKNIASGMTSGVSQITSKIPQITQSIITSFTSQHTKFTTAGEDMVRGIWKGFQNMSGWLESNVRSMMKSIVKAVKSEMQINSPSRVFAGIGEFMAEGLGDGFAQEMRAVEQTIRRSTENAVPNVKATGRTDTRRETPRVEVVQNIYATDTSYAQQQREAARQFRMIAREVMA